MSPRPPSVLTLEYVLLAILDEKPMHGYELYQELCDMKGISLIWNIKQSLLYANLDKLEKKGFLSSELVQGAIGPPRHYFHLTETGKSSLQTWKNTSVRKARNLRQEFLAKLIIAQRNGKSEALKLIQIQEQACQNWLNELKMICISPDQDHMDEWLVYSFRMNRVEGVLKWLKECESEIDCLIDQDYRAKRE